MSRHRKESSEEKCYRCGGSHIASHCTAALNVPEELAKSQVTSLEGGASLVEVYGDLMTAQDSLCHCVSECLAMGKGIAVLFKQQFGRVDELKRQQVRVGGVAVLAVESRFVYYLITKPRYSDKPTYASLGSSLSAMFQHMLQNGVKSVSMPEIGCGLDGLTWPNVQQQLCQLLAGTGITCTVYHFRPAQQMWSAKGKYA